MNAPEKIRVLPHFLIGERKKIICYDSDYYNNRSENHISIHFSLAKVVLWEKVAVL